jgi:hypothetical protein
MDLSPLRAIEEAEQHVRALGSCLRGARQESAALRQISDLAEAAERAIRRARARALVWTDSESQEGDDAEEWLGDGFIRRHEQWQQRRQLEGLGKSDGIVLRPAGDPTTPHRRIT